MLRTEDPSRSGHARRVRADRTPTTSGPASGTTPRWLSPFFRMARVSPSATRALRPLASWVVPHLSRRVRTATRLNARRIFGRELSPSEQRRYTRRVVGSFYDFVADVGRASTLAPERLRELVDSVEGLSAYREARAQRRGAVLVTAHIGTFEAGLAALAGEERRIRVVFRRDSSPEFESSRSRLRNMLGVIEAPIDDGWSSWMPLREALLNDEVVVMQGDRPVPGQRSQVVPFLHGRLRLPTGPARLARVANCPIIPVFAPRVPGGRYKILIGAPIEPVPAADTPDDAGTPADLVAISRAIAGVVAHYPDQWLVLEPVFDEDAPDGR